MKTLVPYAEVWETACGLNRRHFTLTHSKRRSVATSKLLTVRPQTLPSQLVSNDVHWEGDLSSGLWCWLSPALEAKESRLSRFRGEKSEQKLSSATCGGDIAAHSSRCPRVSPPPCSWSEEGGRRSAAEAARVEVEPARCASVQHSTPHAVAVSRGAPPRRLARPLSDADRHHYDYEQQQER